MEIKNSLFSKLDPYRNKLDPKTEAAGARTREAGGDEPGTGRTAAGDRVNLSSTARLHTAAHTEANRAPEIRQEKIDAIKERIASGEYSPDAKAIAAKILENEGHFADALKE